MLTRICKPWNLFALPWGMKKKAGEVTEENKRGQISRTLAIPLLGMHRRTQSNKQFQLNLPPTFIAGRSSPHIH